MSDNLSKLLAKGLLFGIAGLGILFVIMIFSGSDTGIDLGLRLTYVAMFLAIGLTVVFAIVGLITHGRSSLPTLIGAGLFILLVVICYAIAGSEVLPQWAKVGVTPSISKLVGGGIITFYVLLGATAAAILWSEVSRFFK